MGAPISANTPGTRKRAGRIATLAATVIAATAVSAIVSASASAATETVWDNTPPASVGNVPSVGFQATQASEFGGQVEFTGTNRANPAVTVTMSSFGCVSGTWNGGDCFTPSGAKFSHEARLNIYKRRANEEPGRLLAVVTKTFQMPYRPSANLRKCNGANAGKWWHAANTSCNNGKAFPITFKMGDTTLPDKVIIGVEYDTSTWGYEPIGTDPACFVTTEGCPYDSLNVGTRGSPSVGTYPLPDDAYYNSNSAGQYCDGGAGGTDTFRRDPGPGCWTGFQPAFKVTATP
jgi:hypothetical protein